MKKSDEEFNAIVEKVLNGFSNVIDFFTIGHNVWINFEGSRRGGTWQAQMEFDDDGEVTRVYCPNQSLTPDRIAQEISEEITKKDE